MSKGKRQRSEKRAQNRLLKAKEELRTAEEENTFAPIAKEEDLPAKEEEQPSLKKGEYAILGLTNLPWGFFEAEMVSFFSQFGKVIKAVVPRSNRTGNPKGFGYVQFEFKEVAEEVQRAFDGYVMFGQAIKARNLLVDEDVYKKLFRQWRAGSWRRRDVTAKREASLEASLTDPIKLSECEKITKKKTQEIIDKLRAAGIEIDKLP